MILITKDNVSSFIEYYHNLHDSYIPNVSYDIKLSKIELAINVFWSGKPILNKDKYYETNSTKLKMIFSNIEKCNIKEIFSWDYINDALIKYINIKNKDYICFANDESNPLIYIVCDKIEYEELK